MIQNAILTAHSRVDTGKEAAAKLRAQGRIPAVMYGKDMDPQWFSLDRQETEYLFQRIAVENTIVSLEVEGEDDPVQTLIREIQTHPHKPGILHVDFLRIQKGVAVELDIPVHLDGTPVGVRESGGVLEQILNEIRIKCIPSLIPEAAVLEVTGLGVGDSLHVSDLDLGEGVELLTELERTVCAVAIPKAIVEPTEEEEEEELEEGEEEAAGEEDAEDSAVDSGEEG